MASPSVWSGYSRGWVEVSTPIFDLFADFVFFLIAGLATRHPDAGFMAFCALFLPGTADLSRGMAARIDYQLTWGHGLECLVVVPAGQGDRILQAVTAPGGASAPLLMKRQV